MNIGNDTYVITAANNRNFGLGDRVGWDSYCPWDVFLWPLYHSNSMGTQIQFYFFLYIFLWLLFVVAKLPHDHHWRIRKTDRKLSGLNIKQPEKK